MKAFRRVAMWNALTMIVALLLAGCNGIGNKNVSTVTTQTVIYQGEQPVMVLDWDGIHYIGVGDASQELLIERGLMRLDTGQVIKQP